MTTAPKQKDHVRTQLRIPKHLHSALTQAAELNGRSLNAEVIARLQSDPVLSRLDDIKRQNSELKDIARRILDNVIR